jgi:hypothetical protein
MPLLTSGHRFVVDKLAEEITQVVFGFDGSIATSEDGGAGRPAITVTPTVRIIDDNTLSVEAKLSTSEAYSLPLREVCIRSASTPLFRYTYDAVDKTKETEILFATIIEVN